MLEQGRRLSREIGEEELGDFPALHRLNRQV